MLFNEPKLLKLATGRRGVYAEQRFSALQRAEIAEINTGDAARSIRVSFSALQRAEIAEIPRPFRTIPYGTI